MIAGKENSPVKLYAGTRSESGRRFSPLKSVIVNTDLIDLKFSAFLPFYLSKELQRDSM